MAPAYPVLPTFRLTQTQKLRRRPLRVQLYRFSPHLEKDCLNQSRFLLNEETYRKVKLLAKNKNHHARRLLRAAHHSMSFRIEAISGLFTGVLIASPFPAILSYLQPERPPFTNPFFEPVLFCGCAVVSGIFAAFRHSRARKQFMRSLEKLHEILSSESMKEPVPNHTVFDRILNYSIFDLHNYVLRLSRAWAAPIAVKTDTSVPE